MIDNIMKDAKPKMKLAIESLENDLSRVRTGRANPGILDGVIVSYYGASTPIREVATIAVPEANQITIKPWDRNALGDIEGAIRNSDIGLSPVNDGTQIRLVLPPMTEERRKELVFQIKKMAEETKVALRNVRREIWDKVQTAQKNNEATEDDRYRAEEELNKIINEMNKEVDNIIAEKEKEVMRI